MRINGFTFDADDYMQARFGLFADDGGEEAGGGGGSAGDGGQGGEGEGGDDAGKGGDGGGSGDGDEGGEGAKPGEGLMANAGKGGGDEGDQDSDKTIQFASDGKTEDLTVPKKWIGEDGEINHGAILKSALDAGKSVRQLQNELAEAKKGVKPEDGGDVPEKPEGYLTDDVIQDGVFQKPEGVGKLSDIPADDPALVGFTEIAKEAGLTPGQFKTILSKTMLMADGMTPEPFDEAAEAEKFGPNAKAVAVTNKTWADNMHEAGVLSDAEWAHLCEMGKTAVGLSVVNKIRMQTGGKNIPANQTGVAGELPSKQEWYNNKPDHRTDPDGYAKWQEQGKELFGEGAAGSSEAGLGLPSSQGGSMQSRSQQGQNTRTRGTRR